MPHSLQSSRIVELWVHSKLDGLIFHLQELHIYSDLFVCVLLGLKTRALGILRKYSTTLYP